MCTNQSRTVGTYYWYTVYYFSLICEYIIGYSVILEITAILKP